MNRLLLLCLSSLLLLPISGRGDDTIQILHASDLEGGVDAIKAAPNFAAIVEALEADAEGSSIPSILLSAGDNFIPGPFFSAAGDGSLRDTFQTAHDELFGLVPDTLTNIREGDGRADVTIMNILGIDASAFGNHEFDAGTTTLGELLKTDIRGPGLGDVRWLGTQFPYLSTNLDFSSDANLSGVYTSDILPNTDFASLPGDLDAAAVAPKIAQATIIDRGGLKIGVVGATTQRLPVISSPGDTTEATTGGTEDMDALAAALQPVIDALILEGPKIIILTSHLQQISLEEELLTKLSGVDLVIAGGSDTLLADGTDVLHPGDVAAGGYPIITTNLDGDPAAVVSTDGEYSYVGRLIATFDTDGKLLPASIDPAKSGAFATMDDTVEGLWGDLVLPFAPLTKGAQVKRITDGVSSVVTAKDGNIFGKTAVFLEGRREKVRTEETNLGNLTADANLWVAQQYDSSVAVSLKNGGGIRAPIGAVDGFSGELLITPANPDAGKEEGDISQLDIENSLRFNNELSLVTLSAADLKEILEAGLSGVAPGATPGSFPQVGGMAVTYDPSAEAGSRVTDLVIKNAHELVTDVVVRDGAVVGDPDREIRVVTLNFLAGGGDGYPFDTLGEDRVDLVGTLTDPGVATFAAPGSEQDAMAEYVAAWFAETPFMKAETAPRFDRRIQRLDQRWVNGNSLVMKVLGTYETRIFDEGASEIVDFDPMTQRAFVVNADAGVLDVLDLSDPSHPVLLTQVDQPGSVNSVAVKNGIVATAVQNDDDTLPGWIVFHDTDGNVLSTVTAGVLPDMVTFSPDGLKVLTANEGEPLSDYSVDPEGSVTIVDLGDGSLDAVAALAEDAGVQVTFEAFNDKVASLANKGIRIFGPGSTVAQDLEPEYIAVSPDGTKAFVTLQENNGIAVIDIAAGKVLDILPLGYKDHSKGQPWLEAFTWKDEDLPELGLSTADDSTPILLGGFSGLWYAADESTDESKVFYTIPDRGPNGDAFAVDGVTNREFLLPDYQARIVKFTLDTTTGALAVADQILLTRDDGGPVPILGLPNIPGWDEVPLNGKSEEVAYDPYGGDMEGIVRHPDGTFWTVDEYRPAIYHFEADGSLIERYVPEGTSLLGDTPMPEGTYGAETLPAEYAKRWSNRGFEAVALDPDNDIVYAFIQSPMHNPDNSTQNKSDVIRILGVNAADGTPVSEYIYLLERNADAGFGFARTDKIGDAVYAGNGKFYVLERDSSTPDDPTIGHKYIFEIDINYATNLMDGDAPAPLEGKTWEQHSADDLAAVGVSPVWKLKVTNLPTLGYVPSDKAEGLALMEDGTLAICNDNDFTQAGYPDLTLGLVHFGDNNAIDASNRDDAINIVNWPVLGMYQPDSIAAYEYEGVTYLVTANEGDARDYDAFSEEERVGGLTLDPTVFPDAATLQEDENLGRLNSTTATGDLDGDGDHDRIFAYGARSFSIWDQYGNLVFDSGADLELITSLYLPADFNSTNTENDSFDSRSDDKGPEPEGLALGEFNGHTYAFIGLERIGGVVVYDITHPQHPAFMTYINNRDFSGDAEAFTAGDLGPEGLKFVSAEDSPTRMPLLIVGNEISGTTTVYSVDSLMITPPGSFGVAGVDQTSISLSWVKTGAGTVIIEKWVDGKWVEIAAIDGEETTWTDTGLKPGSKNKYRIFQKDGDAYSAIGDTIELKTDGDSIPVNDPSTSIIASTTTEPYVTGAGISKVFSMLTVGDEVPLTDGDEATYRMVGIPDGLGALDNGDGTFSLFVHHELPSSEGIERDHGAIGAFISEWIISKFGGEGGLEVLSGQDLIKTVMVWDPDAGEYVEADAYAFNRLCSADLPGPGAFYFNGFGTHERLFLGGEENDAFFGTPYGRAFATFVTGEEKGTTYEIPRLGDYAFENVVASPFPQKKTIVVGLDDSASSTEDTLGEIWIYVGDKTKEGSEFEKSGLNNGSLYAVAVEGLPIENIPFGLGLGKGSTAAFSLVDFGDVSDDDGTGLFDLTVANNELGVTKFMRPEDGHWDTLDPNSFFFVTTGRFGAPGRVWKLIFDDITHPEEGGTIQLVLDGSEGMTSPDNITVNWKGDLLIQEDPGGAALQARIWKSDRATGETYVVAEHNADFFTPEGANFLTTNEEASGIIDMKDILGYGWYLISVQAHADNADPELVEDGQLAAIFVPDFNMTSAPATASIPMLVPTLDNVKTEAFLTTGDSVGGYRMAGIPDGLGAYDNGDGTFTVLMHHELGNTVGIQRDHGAIGAFISEWTITKPGHPDGGWNVISGGDLIQEVMVWDRGSGKYKANPAVSFNRFCSADLPAIGAFYWDGYGTEDRIFLGGEENDAFYGSEYGKAWAHAATGDYKGTSWEIPRLGQSSWENIVASPYPQLKTIVAGLDDSASADFDTLGEVYFYIGNKEMEGSPVEKAGLTNGNLFAVAVDGLPIESIATGIGNGRGSSAPFGLAPLEDVSDDNGSQLFAETVANNPLGVTKFMRPEDGHWNPLNPNEFYFVTTGRFGAPGRLFRLAFHDIKNPEAGGIITVVLDGTEGMVNPDNLVVDHLGNILIQEDPGGNSRLSKIWRYRPGADVLEIIAEHNPLYFDPSGDLFMTTNEEASGIIDLKSIVGPGWYLADVQAHASNADPELVENGQLVAIYAPIEQMEGPSTKTGPYVVPSIASVDTTSVLTVGDSIGGYRMAGIPDGLGALDNKDGTFSLFVHHELGETVGVERAHGGIGAFISKWVITTHHHACGPLQVLEGSDLIQTVMIYNPVSGEYEAADPAYTFNRFCSADLAGPGAFYWNGLGTQYRIFTGGEENDGFFGGDYGRAFATFVNGPDEGTTYDLPWMGKLAFENVVPSPYPQLHTIVAGLDDSASNNNDTLGEIYFYVGVKTDEGSEFEKSGLKGGDLFAVAVEGLAIEDIENGIGNGAGSSLPFTLAALPDVSADDGSGLFDLTVAENELGITKFLRPEDGAWDPNNPNCFYFVTTGRFGAPGRLFKLTFDSIETPEAGGIITLVLDGTEGIVNADNITVDRNSNVLIQEDPGGSSRLARIWFYDAHTGELTDIAQHDPKFFDPDSEFLITTNEEASGIIDVSHILGEGLYLISDQVHANSDDPELVEGGQIALVKVPYTPPAVPELRLNVVGTYETGIFDEGASEIVDYDPMTQRGFIVNAQAGVIDVLDLSDPSNPTLIAQVTQPGSVNSVAVKNGIVVTAVQNDDGTQPGWLVFHDTDGNVLSQVTAGVLPDNVVFSPDGLKVLSANEGEPLSDYSVDPEGSVTIVDLGDGSIASVSALTDDDVIQVTFEAYNDRLYSLLNKGIRIFGPGSTVAQDLEPEYITVIDNLAYVTLQENNAFAVINCDTGAVLDILPLGYKDHSSGQPELHNFTFEDQDLPVLGLSTKDDETPILLGGFSGLWYAADESSHETKVFYTIPDRGPNGDAFTVDGVTSREFLLPDYQARIVRVELNEWTGALAVTDQILLTREDGGPVPIHGLPNIPGWDEVPLNGKSEAVDYDPYGGDMEGIVRHPDGTFWTVDEYRPAIYHFAADGSLIERYVPEGTSLLGDTPMPEGTYGAETLPAEYAKRWSNRGFEAVALDPEKDVVYAFIQSPMHNPDNSTQNKSDIIRVLGINAADGTPVEEYIYLLERNAGSGYSFARTDKIGDAVYAGKGRFYVIERDSSTPDDPGYGHKYIFEMDINPATNLLADGAPEPMDGLTWEQHSAEDLNAQGVRPVWKRKVLNLPTLGYIPSDKAEGLALMEDGSLAIANDNDFTQAGYPDLTLGIIHFGKNNALDASNRDDGINITNWPVLGMYQPDSIASYKYGDQIFLVTANEGDARDYDAFSEEERVGGLTLDPDVFPDADFLQENENLGRLNSTTATGDLDGDGDHDRIFAYGARSFSIWDQYGNLVFDSGDHLERMTARYEPENFNSTNDENGSFDSRSDDKGPEPEGIALGEINGRTYLFLGLERIGGVAIYDISSPHNPQFVNYINNRDFNGDAQTFTAGDLGPEGLKFVPAMDSPTRRPLLIVGNEISGTTTIFDIGTILLDAPTGFSLFAVDDSSITLAWKKLANASEDTQVVIEKWVDGKWTQVASLDAEVNNWTDDGLEPGSENSYRIFSVNGGVYSAIGDTLTIETDGPLGPVLDPSANILASTTTDPYLTGADYSKTFAMLTVGDEVPHTGNPEGTYRMAGIPDGLGALDNGDGTFSLFVHHEIPSNEGIERDHGSIGSFISEWQVTKFGGEGGLQVLSGQDLIQEVLVWDVDTQSFITNESNAFNRLCSADLPGPGAFWFNGFGTPYRIFTGGEENDAFFGGDYGKAWATFVNGPEKGTSYEIPRLGQLAFENVVASPYPQKKTIVAGLDDSASSDFDTLGEVYFYIGEKMKTGTEFEKAGLDNGELYAVSVWGLPVEDIDHGLGDGKGSTAMFKLVNLGNVADDDGTDLYEKTVANNPLGITKFMRPEDGHWDTQDPASFYFVTTGRFGAPGRVWKLTFDDIKYPENGGTLTLVLDGTEGMLNPDNLTVNWKGDLLIQEDPGGNAIQARIWKSDKATGETYIVAEHNADFFTAEGANFITTNEEASGIIDMKDILGYGWYLVSVQAHADSEDPELVEGGQLAAIYVPDTNMISAPSTASIPMLVPTNNFTKTVALLTTGDVVSYPNNQEGAYRMAGTPDGLGAYDNGDGTFTVLMHHELGASAGIERAHGSIGAFISEWIITKPGHEAGDWMVLSGSDLITDTLTWNTALQKWDNDSVALNRFCSADLAPQSAFYFDGFGTEERIFLGGEESDAAFGDPYGKAWATLATGSLKGYSYELPRLGRMSFENVVASPYPQMKTIVAGLDDSASNSNDTLGEVYFYIGEKNGAAGPPIAKAGLNNGNLYALAVDGLPIEKIRTGLGKGKGAVAPFRLANLGDVSDDDGTGLYDMTVANNSLGVTKFLRPEDGHWNPLNPNEFYFVTTGRFGGPGRLWKVIFTDIQNPEIGGLLELVLDGTEGMVSPDNIVVDYQGNVFIQEDPGGSARLAKIWRYRPGTNKVEIVAEHNPLYFDPSGDLFETQNEEASGIIDLVDIIGPGWYLADVQNHTPSEDLELVEGGQLLAIYSQGIQDIGPSTGDEPMLVPTIAKVSTTNILSVGDDVDGYRMAGIPDGMGALDNKDGTFSLFVHHELTSTSGVERAHGGIGAFISKWTITGPHHEWGPLQVLEGEDLIKTVMIWNPDSESYEAADAYAFNRLCSADLAGPGAFYYNGLGTHYRIFTGGEENDAFYGGEYGKAFATFVNGPDEGITYDLPWMGKLAWENVVASPYPQIKTIVAGLDDSASADNDTLGEIYFYIGEKTSSGSEFEKSGLYGGDLYAVAVEGLPIEEIETGIGSGAGSSLPFTLASLPDVSEDDGTELFGLTGANNALGITKFLRPEDGAWDPNHPECFYFVTTGRFGAPGRLFKLTFDDISNPETGGTITLVLDGTEGIVNADNITVDRNSNVLIQEDPGGATHLARVWFYDTHTGELTDVARHNPDIFAPGAPNFLTTNEESSGIIDVSDILGEGWYLASIQAHASHPSPALVEYGQLNALHIPYTPTAAPGIRMNVLGTYTTNIFDEGASEIVDYDPTTQRAYIVNALAGVIDVLDVSDPTNPTKIATVTQPGPVNSVAVKNGIVATAVENEVATDPGYIVLHDTDGNVLATLTAGVLPDNIVFSPDGLKVLTANEGQPSEDYTVDPEGSVTIVDLGDGSIASVSALTQDDVTQVTFEGFNDQKYSLINKGIRIFGPGATVAQDLEPEYITVIDNLAYVTLQENNALAVINCETGAVLDLLPLGFKDHSSGQPVLEQFTFDPHYLPELGLSTADDSTPILLGGFSGLWYAEEESTPDTKVFYTIPDRGPNGDAFTVDGVTSREFLLPDYQARIVRFELDAWNGGLSITDQILLTRSEGENSLPIHGVPNIPGWDEVPLNGKSEPVDYDPYGGDMEGIVRHPDGTFWTVDEYRPAIYHFEADGSLIERYVPEGTSLLGDTPQAVGYYGAETLPAEYAKRWSNRGFEAVALDPEKNVVYAFIQSPLHNPDSSTQNKSDVIRILGIDATDGTPVEEYIYLLERNANSGYSFARTDKIGDAVFAGNGKFFVLERDSSTPAQPTIGHKYIFEIDISLATNLLGDGAPTPIEGKTWEQHSAEDIAAQGVRPVWKRKVTNLPTLGYLPSDKAEGLALMEDGSLAIANDNDFTQAGFPDLTLGIIHFGKNNALDASNRDDSINITNWPTLGMYQPDTIGSYRFGEDIFLVTANEGDARDYEGFSEEERVGGLTLDENQFPDAEALQQDENLGRLNSTTATGDLDGDGDHDRIFSYGARSFSIWDRYGNLVFDSGDDLELITALYDPDNFNSNNDENDSFDSRSDDKGPEPEGLTLGSFNGRTYLFLGLERIGGVMIYDITNPFAPDFIDYFNNRNFDGDAEAFTAGDLGPEGLKFVSAMDSPTRRPMLIVGNEVSGTTTFFDLGTILIPESDGFDLSAATSDTATFSLLDQIGEGESIVIERFDEATGRWVKIATVTADNPVFQDSGLKPDSSYKYRTFKVVGGIYSQVGDEITVSTQDFDGFYFGLLDGGKGSFGAWLTAYQTATVIIHLYGDDSVFSVDEVPVADNGTFSVEMDSGDIITGTIGYGMPPEEEPLQAKGAVRDLNLASEDDPYLSVALNSSEAVGSAFRVEGASSFGSPGYYEGLIGSGKGSGLQISLISPSGDIYALVMFDGGTTESGVGTIGVDGNLTLTTNLDTELTGNYNSDKKLFSGGYERKGAINTGEKGFFNFLDPVDDTVMFDVDRLKNISTRVFAGQNDSSAIAGFIIEGDAPKTVLINAKGWDLHDLGFENFLLDGIIVLNDSEGNEIETSDNWIEQANADVIAATGVAPAGYHDPAIMAVLAPGAYTAVVSSKFPIDQGIAVIEVYEVNNGKVDQASRLKNISTRGEVRTDEAVMIGGFIIGGSNPKKVYIRSVGPSLPLDDGKLADPRISLRDKDGNEVLANDNWRDASNVAEIEATQIPPQNDSEAAAVVELEPGAYTVIVDGADGGTGVAIVEVFEIRE